MFWYTLVSEEPQILSVSLWGWISFGGWAVLLCGMNCLWLLWLEHMTLFKILGRVVSPASHYCSHLLTPAYESICSPEVLVDFPSQIPYLSMRKAPSICFRQDFETLSVKCFCKFNSQVLQILDCLLELWKFAVNSQVLMHKYRKAFVELNIKINANHQCSCLAFSCYNMMEPSHSSIQFGTSGFQRQSAMQGIRDACSDFLQTLRNAMVIFPFFLWLSLFSPKTTKIKNVFLLEE